MRPKIKIHIAITVAVMAFIFLQSALPGDLSGAESGLLVNILHEITGIDPNILSVLVRKIAHFTEYMILGICLQKNADDWRHYLSEKNNVSSSNNYPDVRNNAREQNNAGEKNSPDRSNNNARGSNSIAHSSNSNISGCNNARASNDNADGSASAIKYSLCAWATGTIYSITDEIHQMFVPGRACAPLDMLIDSAGVAAGVIIAGMMARKK